MSKYGFLLFGSAFLLISTLVIDSMEGINSSGSLVGTLPEESGVSISMFLSMIQTFFNMMTFNIEGVPFFFNLIFLSFAIVMIVIILDLLPFT